MGMTLYSHYTKGVRYANDSEDGDEKDGDRGDD